VPPRTTIFIFLFLVSDVFSFIMTASSSRHWLCVYCTLEECTLHVCTAPSFARWADVTVERDKICVYDAFIMIESVDSNG
jgi:hypothetical protein